MRRGLLKHDLGDPPDLRRLFKDVEDPYLAAIYSNLAMIFDKMLRYDEAEILLKDVVAMYRRLFKTDNAALATSLGNLGMFYTDMGRYTEAEPLLVEALAMCRRLFKLDYPALAASLNNLAGFYVITDRDAEAEPLQVEASTIYCRLFEKNHPARAIGISNLAIFYDNQGEITKAIDLFKELVQSLEAQSELSNQFESEAEQLMNIQQQSPYWEYLYSFFLRHHRKHPELAGEMFNLALHAKGLVIGNIAQHRKIVAQIRNADRLTQQAWDRYTKAHTQLARLYADIPIEPDAFAEWKDDITRLKDEANAAEKELVRRSSAFAESKQKITWVDVQRSLKEDGAAVEFLSFPYLDGKQWTGTIQYCALVLRPGYEQPVVLPLCEAKQLADILKSPGENKASYVRDNQSSMELYNLVWRPLVDKLAGVRQVYLSPAGMLHTVSFAVLRASDGKLLCEKIELQYLSSTKDMARNTKTEEETEKKTLATAAVFGGARFTLDDAQMRQAAAAVKQPPGAVVMRGGDVPEDPTRASLWDDLPGTKIEAVEIHARLKKAGWTVQTFIEEYALEDALKSLPAPSLLHLATHGFFFPKPVQKPEDRTFMLLSRERQIQRTENPMLRSGLLFAGANRAWKGEPPLQGVEDGILTAYEVAHLNLVGTELVVLSACDTGLGDVGGGEGVFGLQRAFIAAGAEAVLMSLWKVPDEQTLELMGLFYDGWLGGKSKPDAFADAQQTLREKYPDTPYYWAGFVLIGE